MATEGLGVHRGPSTPSQAALGRVRAELGIWALNSIRTWSCQETEELPVQRGR